MAVCNLAIRRVYGALVRHSEGNALAWGYCRSPGIAVPCFIRVVSAFHPFRTSAGWLWRMIGGRACALTLSNARPQEAASRCNRVTARHGMAWRRRATAAQSLAWSIFGWAVGPPRSTPGLAFKLAEATHPDIDMQTHDHRARKLQGLGIKHQQRGVALEISSL